MTLTPWKGRGESHLAHFKFWGSIVFKFWGPNHIFRIDEARYIRFHMQIDSLHFSLLRIFRSGIFVCLLSCVCVCLCVWLPVRIVRPSTAKDGRDPCWELNTGSSTLMTMAVVPWLASATMCVTTVVVWLSHSSDFIHVLTARPWPWLRSLHNAHHKVTPECPDRRLCKWLASPAVVFLPASSPLLSRKRSEKSRHFSACEVSFDPSDTFGYRFVNRLLLSPNQLMKNYTKSGMIGNHFLNFLILGALYISRIGCL